MKPNIILIIHYTFTYNSTSTSFSDPNTNGGPGNQSFGLLLGISELGKRGCRSWVGEGLYQVLRCDDD